MLRQAADLEEALNKKGGLTLSQLANYDDIITDSIVDRVYYWSTIRKLKANYHACRGVHEETVCNILQRHAVIDKDAISAHQELLKLSGLAKFLKNLKTEDEKEHFERHLRKYVNIYLPDCPFEVDTTNRYTVMTAEACIKARKRIKKGESIKYLSGIQVEMTEREEKELSSRTDFSIVLSSRRKRPSLFLGPARFANHDCDSNARLNTTGAHGIHIVARKDIEAGDEITVTYGEDYFGIDNSECLCGTCESHQRNGWDPQGPLLPSDSSDDEEDEDQEEEVRPPIRANRPVPQKQQSKSPSSLGKRKRGEDKSTALDEHGQPKVAKKRGRPRKHPLPEPDDNPDVDKDNESKRKLFWQRNGLGHSARSEVPDRGLHQDRPSFFGRISHSLSRDRNSGRRYTPTKDDLLERIYSMLCSVGDRKIKEEEAEEARLATPSSIQDPSSAGAEVHPQSEVAVEVSRDMMLTPRGNAGQLSQRAQITPPASALSTPSYTRGLSRRSSIDSLSSLQSFDVADTSKLEVPKSRLSTLKKERSASSLRNVVTIADENIYSVSASPASSDLTKRKRGRPRKDQRSDKNDESLDYISPSSSNNDSNNDSSSSVSLASSATSLETCAARNIASSICQMLTSNEEKVLSGGVSVEGCRDFTEQCEDDVEMVDADEDEEQPSSDQTQGERRLRTSPIKAQYTSSAPVTSIERDGSAESTEGEEKRGTIRTPGDYHLCEALLATPYHRWIECRNCDEHFLQADAYLTRIACPRCERHSKLYGYYWPKTDKEGKFDTEERVLDHRTINRFIEPGDERFERKGRKTLADVIRERELSSRQESEESDRVEKRLRNSSRTADGRRKLRTTL